MKVLGVVPYYFPFQDRGGPVVKVRSLVHALRRRGHQLTVLTPDLGLTAENCFGIRAQRCKWGWRYEEEGVSAIYLRSWARYR
ncbi:MAG: hypothetical protein WCD27_02015, partial [Candidatus Acidiferrales bacterium]